MSRRHRSERHNASDLIVLECMPDLEEEEDVWDFQRIADEKPSITVVRGYFKAMAGAITTEDDKYFERD